MKAKRVGVVMGGTSTERERSLHDGRALAAALAVAGHEVVRVVLDGSREALELLGSARLDAAFVTVGADEHAQVQAALELAEIPSVGSNAETCARAADRLTTLEAFRQHNLPTSAGYGVAAAATEAELREKHGSFGFPVRVRPRSGVSTAALAHSLDELVRAVADVNEHDEIAVVERTAAGVEVVVTLLEGRVLGVAERGEDGFGAVRSLPESRVAGLRILAERAGEVLGVRGLATVEFAVSLTQNESVVAVDAQPSLAEGSAARCAIEATGFDLPSVCTALLGRTLRLAQSEPPAHSIAPDAAEVAPFALAV